MLIHLINADSSLGRGFIANEWMVTGQDSEGATDMIKEAQPLEGVDTEVRWQYVDINI